MKPFEGCSKSSHDIVIDGCRLICTCIACPEQYEVFDDDTGDRIGYLRLRYGSFRAEVHDCCGTTVYAASPIGQGTFEDEEERMKHLTAAISAIRSYANS